MSATRQKARVLALSDQNWASLREHIDDIVRIAEGNILPEDSSLIQGMASMVAGDLYLRAAETMEATP